MAARAIDRAAMQAMRAARLHAEERELEHRAHLVAAAPLMATTPPATTYAPPALGSPPVVVEAVPEAMFAPPAVSRTELQRIRAARLHHEERELERASAKNTCVDVISRSRADSMLDHSASHGVGTTMAAASYEEGSSVGPMSHLIPPPHTPGPAKASSGGVWGVPVVGPVGSIFAFDLPQRSELHRLRAMRVHDEERDVERAEADATVRKRARVDVCVPSFGVGLSWGVTMTSTRRELHAMRARRVHDEERDLEAASIAGVSELSRSMLVCQMPVC